MHLCCHTQRSRVRPLTASLQPPGLDKIKEKDGLQKETFNWRMAGETRAGKDLVQGAEGLKPRSEHALLEEDARQATQLMPKLGKECKMFEKHVNKFGRRSSTYKACRPANNLFPRQQNLKLQV